MASAMAALRSTGVNCLQGLHTAAPRKNRYHQSVCVAGFQLHSAAALPRLGHHLCSQNFGRGVCARRQASDMGKVAATSESPAEEGSFEFAQGELAARAAAGKKSIFERLYPYIQLARLEKPFGNWAMIFISFWAISLATPAGALPNPTLLGLFALIQIVNRSAMCTINDLVDMDLDMQVERSKTRPLASGAITRMQAIGFFAFEIVLLGALALPLNGITRTLLAAYVPIFSIYPLMKRITFFPQGYLSLCIAWPILAGWTAVCGSLDQPAAFLPVFATSAFYMCLADTIYAHADKKDDAKAGVKSTARFFGDNTKPFLSVLCAACVGGLAFTGVNNGLGWSFYAVAGAGLVHLANTIRAVDLDIPKDCIAKFHSTAYMFSSIVFAAITLGKLT